MKKVKTTERGWAGHFICSNRCRFRRNTLVEYNDIKIVVSTVGLMVDALKREEHGFSEIGYKRYFETMAFHADPSDTRYHDADVKRNVYFDSEWMIGEIDADDRANVMHDNVVKEISARLESGETFDNKEAPDDFPKQN